MAMIATYIGPSRAFAAAIWFDIGLTFLIISSVGAWSLGLIMMLRPENPFWFQAALHLFLDLFADGWLTLVLLGLAYAALENARPRLSRGGLRLLVVGLPLTFILGIPVSLVPAELRILGGVGGWLAGTGLLIIVSVLWQTARTHGSAIWLVPLGFLGLKAAAQIVWNLSLIQGWRAVTISVILLLLTLLPLTGLWPAAWRGSWVFYGAAVGAALPVAAMSGLYLRTLTAEGSPPAVEESEGTPPIGEPTLRTEDCKASTWDSLIDPPAR